MSFESYRLTTGKTGDLHAVKAKAGQNVVDGRNYTAKQRHLNPGLTQCPI
jgi:hypothetical protein